MNLINKTKQTIKALVNGSKQLRINQKLMKELSKKEQLNRSEFQLVYKTRQDLKKTIPFFLLMLVLPEALPFLLLSGSRMIPSVCISKEDLEKRNTKIDLKRKELKFKDVLENTKPGDTGIESTIAKAKAKQNLDDSQLTNIQLINSLSASQIKFYTKYYQLPTIRPKFIRKLNLLNLYEYIQKDDELITNECDKEILIERGMNSVEQYNCFLNCKRSEKMSMPKELFEQYYQEYSTKIQQSRQQLLQIRTSLQSRSREQKLTQLTLSELSSSRSDVYKTVGKMFIKEDYDAVLGDLKGKVDLYTRDVLAMEKMALKTDGELKDYERNLESLVKKVSAA
ncbi:hypothetical protein HDV01_003101 [Terramyces sp. JEL0728]|nr:hypothetical protein HDV01_003101 [Terramyces sp. JEL0728]